jgi:hypothetical protein
MDQKQTKKKKLENKSSKIMDLINCQSFSGGFCLDDKKRAEPAQKVR